MCVCLWRCACVHMQVHVLSVCSTHALADAHTHTVNMHIHTRSTCTYTHGQHDNATPYHPTNPTISTPSHPPTRTTRRSWLTQWGLHVPLCNVLMMQSNTLTLGALHYGVVSVTLGSKEKRKQSNMPRQLVIKTFPSTTSPRTRRPCVHMCNLKMVHTWWCGVCEHLVSLITHTALRALLRDERVSFM